MVLNPRRTRECRRRMLTGNDFIGFRTRRQRTWRRRVAVDPSARFKTTSFFTSLQSLEGYLSLLSPISEYLYLLASTAGILEESREARHVLPENHQHRATERCEPVSESRGRFSSNLHRGCQSHPRPLLTGGCDCSTCPYTPPLRFMQELIGLIRSTGTRTPHIQTLHILELPLNNTYFLPSTAYDKHP
jgi:hypothetical protein